MCDTVKSAASVSFAMVRVTELPATIDTKQNPGTDCVLVEVIEDV